LKRCPECNSLFPDAEYFCELDGTPLVTVDDAPNPVIIDRRTVVPSPNSSLKLLPVGALIGLLLGVLLFLVYFAMSRPTAQENSNTSSSSSSAQQQQSLHPLQPAPRATANPSVEPSVEPSASPSETPSPENSPAEVESSSSSNPISTASGATASRGPVIIKLDSGVTIEADDAWKTAEGIWYRKHGVVSLLDPKNVKNIEKVSPATPQPSAAAKSPSP
jgi:cytoskeletal protein RodZ